MRGPRFGSRAGFSLMELVVGLSLMGLVALSFAFLYGASQRHLIQNMNFVASQGEAGFGLEHVKRHLMLATAVGTPSIGNTAGQLEFTWQPTIQSAAITSRYTLVNGDLRFTRDVSAGGFEVVARDIDAVAFERPQKAGVVVDVTARRTAGGDVRQMNLRTTISPRGIL